MIQLIKDLPLHVAGLHAFADVTEAEYECALILLLDELLKKHKKINFILVLETNIKNFAHGKWCGNVKVGLRYFFKWNKLAIVTDQKDVYGFSDVFKYFIPGKFRDFRLDQMELAVKWVSAK